jgi:CRP-like cAMP-binding protein
MNEFETIKKYVARHIQLTEDEENYFTSLLRITKVKKKQFIVQPDFVCRYRTYIYKGAMRSYLLDKNAQEHTVLLSIDDWWISDYNSYIYQEPATLFVEALEDSILIQIDYNSEQLLKETLPKFEKFFRIITERSLAFFHGRMMAKLSMTAEELYDDYLKRYPQICQRVPQYALASYLGMTTEYLSKLRNRKVSKKS